MSKTTIVHADHIYAEWLQTLDIYSQELTVLKGHLTELAEKAILPDVSNKIKVYDERLDVEEKNIDSLRQEINEGLVAISEHADLDGSWYIDNKLSSQYNRLSEQFIAEGKAVDNLKFDLQQFSSALQ